MYISQLGGTSTVSNISLCMMLTPMKFGKRAKIDCIGLIGKVATGIAYTDKPSLGAICLLF